MAPSLDPSLQPVVETLPARAISHHHPSPLMKFHPVPGARHHTVCTKEGWKSKPLSMTNVCPRHHNHEKREVKATEPAHPRGLRPGPVHAMPTQYRCALVPGQTDNTPWTDGRTDALRVRNQTGCGGTASSSSRVTGCKVARAGRSVRVHPLS